MEINTENNEHLKEILHGGLSTAEKLYLITLYVLGANIPTCRMGTYLSMHRRSAFRIEKDLIEKGVISKKNKKREILNHDYCEVRATIAQDEPEERKSFPPITPFQKERTQNINKYINKYKYYLTENIKPDLEIKTNLEISSNIQEIININNINNNINNPPPVSPPPYDRKPHTFPDGWEPKESHRRKCAEYGFDTNLLADAFENHHRAKGSKFKDWDRAFFTWITNEKIFRERRFSTAVNKKQSENKRIEDLIPGFSRMSPEEKQKNLSKVFSGDASKTQ